MTSWFGKLTCSRRPPLSYGGMDAIDEKAKWQELAASESAKTVNAPVLPSHQVGHLVNVRTRPCLEYDERRAGQAHARAKDKTLSRSAGPGDKRERGPLTATLAMPSDPTNRRLTATSQRW